MHAERKRMFVVSTLRLPPHQNLLLTTCSLSWTLSNIIIPCLLLCHEARPVNRFHCLHTSVAAGCESAARTILTGVVIPCRKDSKLHITNALFPVSPSELQPLPAPSAGPLQERRRQPRWRPPQPRPCPPDPD